MTPVPKVQIALDVTSIEEAIQLGRAAISAGADWLEIGKPLVDFQGLSSLTRFVEAFPDIYILADMMVLAGAERYVSAAAHLGISNITTTALAPVETVREVISWGKRLQVQVTVDLFNVPDKVEKIRMYEDLGADYLMVHFGVDEKRRAPNGSPIHELEQVVRHTTLPVSYATYDEHESAAAVRAGAAIIVQGAPLLTAADPRSAFSHFIRETKSCIGGVTQL